LSGIDDIAPGRDQLDSKSVFSDAPAELREIDEDARAGLVFLAAAIQPWFRLTTLQLTVPKTVETIELPRALELHHVLAQPTKALKCNAFDLGINLANHSGRCSRSNRSAVGSSHVITTNVEVIRVALAGGIVVHPAGFSDHGTTENSSCDL